MKVKLISYTTPCEELRDELDIQTATDLIAYCARVSNPSNQSNKETSEKLIDYLIAHQHWSPLEMVSACVEIETTRDIGRQILRHRSFTFQEFSQRYAEVDKESFVIREARMQDPTNRQNSIDINDDEDEDRLNRTWGQIQENLLDVAKDAYQWAIEHGIAKECARVVLPEGNTVTRMYMNGTLRSWVHYILLRREFGTQKEHMAIAREIAWVIARVFPMVNYL